jgi:hypothetical protein
MSVTKALLAELRMDYVYQAGEGSTGYCRSLKDAQQECQAIAAGPLRWGRDGHLWVAREQKTKAAYSIERLPF